MIAYQNDSKFRSKFLRELKWHREHDAIAQGMYGEYSCGKFRGCAVGCGLHSLDRIARKRPKGREYDDHPELARRLGLPLTLVWLQDRIFEGLPRELALDWPLRFARAIKTGADLSLVWPRFAHWLLVDPAAGVIRLAKTEQARAAIVNVAALFADQAGGREPTRAEWEAVRGAAYAAANAAAAAAANAAANAAAAAYAAAAAANAAANAAAANAAADAAANAAANAAADAAADAAAYAHARQQHYQRMADKLIELMEACRGTV